MKSKKNQLRQKRQFRQVSHNSKVILVSQPIKSNQIRDINKIETTSKTIRQVR